MLQVLCALSEIHNDGQVHLDIKPANVAIGNETKNAFLWASALSPYAWTRKLTHSEVTISLQEHQAIWPPKCYQFGPRATRGIPKK